MRRELMFLLALCAATFAGCSIQTAEKSSSISASQNAKPLTTGDRIRAPYNLQVYRSLGDGALVCWLWTGTTISVLNANFHEIDVDASTISYHQVRVESIPEKPEHEVGNEPCQVGHTVLLKVNAYQPENWKRVPGAF